MASAATIDGSTITASTRSTWHITDVSSMVSTTREVGEQYMAPKWDATPFPEMFGAGAQATDAWVMLDLGQEYNLDEIRLWNANVAHGNNGLMGWYAMNMSIHVAGADAVLPSTADGLGEYFTDASWTNIWDGDLAQGPGGTDLVQDQLVDPQLVLDATGNNVVRYVAIDVDSRYDGANHAIALMGHIQIDGIRSAGDIAVISAVRTALHFVEFEVTDVGASEFLPGTVSLSLDGNDVTAGLSVDKDGGVTTIRHDEVPQFAFGATVNYIFAAEDSLGQMIQLDDSFMLPPRLSVVSAATQITGITATARNTWHITEASALVSTNREVGEQYMAPKWDATPFPEFYATSESTDAWVMFDLGAEYDLEEIRLWNANIAHGDAGLMGWYSKNMSIHVADDGAALPSTDAGLGNYFTDASWTKIWDGDLAQGPGGTALVQDQLVDPQLAVNATAYTSIRYVAIDVDSRYDGANHAPALMGHIQIYRVPETFAAFAITEILYDEANDEFTISWTSSDNQTYAVFFSNDLKNFGADVDDSVLSGGDTTTFTFPNPVPNAKKLLFRVSEN